MWGFIWPNALDTEAVEIACPDGQGATDILHIYMCMYELMSLCIGTVKRSCFDGEWDEAQVLECGNSGFNNALTEVT